LYTAVELIGYWNRIVGQCQAAVAEAVEAFGRIDVLLGSTSEAVIGAVEELSQTPRTISLVQDTFETNFFANVNIIKAVLPIMRQRKNGHVIMLTGITGHLGTPGLSMYCSSQWAIEGYCDSLAYEIAPFNIKMSIVQANIEINILTNRLTSVPPLPEYAQEENPAPLAREIFANLLDKIDRINYPGAFPPEVNDKSPTTATSVSTTTSVDMDTSFHEPSTGDLLSSSQVTSLYATLPPGLKSSLIAETVHALTAIGGHDNPPARHIVGFEGVTSVKEKLKTVSEELEDFIEVSSAVDISRDEGSAMVVDTGS
jgi:NAD(P)-dependent dehydrogenase (short-subunit alcohol dehydrogenase family)